jgi:uncharacterized membrane protein
MNNGVGITPDNFLVLLPLPLPKSAGNQKPANGGRNMHPLLLVAIPLALIILGMILNSIGLSFDQPPSSPEQDPVKRLAAERDTFRQFFDRQRSRATKRQERVGQYAWLLLIATIGSFIWLYVDTVGKTTLSTRIASMQTLGSQEGKELVLSLTLSDGDNVKYLIKLPQGDKKSDTKGKEAVAKETVSSWELEKLGTALSIGDNALPLGVALKIAN